MNKLVQITPKDMVAVALQPLAAGEAVSYGAGAVTPLSDIPMGHKVALRDIKKGEPVIKLKNIVVLILSVYLQHLNHLDIKL